MLPNIRNTVGILKTKSLEFY